MTLEQLRIFVAVAERCHVTQAARALNLAQSAASHAIAALESRHQAKLFKRAGRGIELTEAGVVFLEEARAVLARAEAAGLVLSEFGGLKRGTLPVQASQTIASGWLPRHLVTFKKAYPQIQIRLTIGNTAQVAAAVENGTAELGFVEGAVEAKHLVCEAVARDQLIVVVGPEHPWAGGKALTPADLAKAEWVLREPGSGTRSAFEEALSAHGIKPSRLEVRLELPSNEAVRSAVEAGLGATAISASVAAPSLEAGLLFQARFPLPERNFYALRQAGRYRTRTAEALMELISRSPLAAQNKKPRRSGGASRVSKS
jgi:DNA-binding transcriptional LysR family regulator